MPFKDIDIDMLIRQNEIESEVMKKVAINNKLNTSTLDGYRDRLNAIELITGEKYDVPSISERINQEESLLPITNQLDEIKYQIANKPTIQALPATNNQNPNADALKNVYREVMGQDLRVNSREDLTAAIQQIGDLKREIDDKDSAEYKALYNLNEYLKGYRQANFPDAYQRQRRRRLPSVPPTILVEEMDDQDGSGIFSSLSEMAEKLKVLLFGRI